MMSHIVTQNCCHFFSGPSYKGTGPMSAREKTELVLSVLVFGSLSALLLAFGPVGLMG